MTSIGSQEKQTRVDGGPLQIAVLDDYQRVALSLADWATLASRASITVFHDHLSDADDVVRRLTPFNVVCVMRERTGLGRPARLKGRAFRRVGLPEHPPRFERPY
jgi:hypothetical protein